MADWVSRSRSSTVRSKKVSTGEVGLKNYPKLLKTTQMKFFLERMSWFLKKLPKNFR